MKNNILIVFILFFLMITLHRDLICQKQSDVKLHYNKRYAYYTDTQICAFASRFDIEQELILSELDITMLGDSIGGKARVRIFGREGGGNFPAYENDLTPPFYITKTVKGLEKIKVTLKKQIHLKNRQYFVAIDSLSGGIHLASSTKEELPTCYSSTGEGFYNQALKLKNGDWFVGKYKFEISPLYLYLQEVPKEYYFQEVTETSGLDIDISENSCMNSFDYNQDGLLDLLINGKIFLNKGNFKFEYIYDKIDFDKLYPYHIIIDMNKDRFSDILLIDTCTSDSVSPCKLLINNNNNFVANNILLTKIGKILSFSVGDLNHDGYSDICLISQSKRETLNELIVLMNDRNNNFIDKSQIFKKSNIMSNNPVYCTIADFNNDNLLDLYTVNAHTKDQIWLNKGSNILEEIDFLIDTQGQINKKTKYCSKLDASDIDSDGAQDLLFITKIQNQSNINEQFNSFVLKSNPTNTNDINKNNYLAIEDVQSGGKFFDVNNDGLDDIIITTNNLCRKSDLYIRNKIGEFNQISFKSGFGDKGLGNDVITEDFNNDGKIDVLTYESNRILLFKNNYDKVETVNNYIKLDIENFEKVRKVVFYADNDVYHYLFRSNTGILKQCSNLIYQGLAQHSIIDSIFVYLENGKISKFYDVIPNQTKYLKLTDADDINSDICISLNPNPFNNNINISISTKYSKNITINIYNVDGKQISRIANQMITPGTNRFTWDSRDASGREVSSGIYLIQIQTNERIYVEKIIKTN